MWHLSNKQTNSGKLPECNGFPRELSITLDFEHYAVTATEPLYITRVSVLKLNTIYMELWKSNFKSNSSAVT